MVRRLGEENEDVAIVIGSAPDVALFALSMANQGKETWNSARRPNYKMSRGIVSPPSVRKVMNFPCVTLMDAKFFSKRM